MACVDGGAGADAVLAVRGAASCPTATALLYLRDVTAAVAYLHAHNTMHLDLKGANVLLRGGVARTGDFGTTTKGQCAAPST